jgi:predicted peptidase
MLATDEMTKAIAVDPRAVSIWGASMGGAGATTIGFHHPDRFASITSYFGDSKYDVTTYVRSILPDDPTAHQVNALDIVENARNVPVWLVHGEADHVSPIAQSEMLYDAMKARGFDVRFDRVPKRGHEGEVVARFLAEVVAKAASARVPEAPKRVSYWSVRPSDTGAYGVHIERASTKGDAFVDLENKDGVVHVRRATGVRAIALDKGALGVNDGAAIVVDDGSRVGTRWQ